MKKAGIVSLGLILLVLLIAALSQRGPRHPWPRPRLEAKLVPIDKVIQGLRARTDDTAGNAAREGVLLELARDEFGSTSMRFEPMGWQELPSDDALIAGAGPYVILTFFEDQLHRISWSQRLSPAGRAKVEANWTLLEGLLLQAERTSEVHTWFQAQRGDIEGAKKELTAQFEAEYAERSKAQAVTVNFDEHLLEHVEYLAHALEGLSAPADNEERARRMSKLREYVERLPRYRSPG